MVPDFLVARLLKKAPESEHGPNAKPKDHACASSSSLYEINSVKKVAYAGVQKFSQLQQVLLRCQFKFQNPWWRRSGQSVTASDFGSNGPRFESGRGRCVESLDKALYSHCPKEKPSH